MNRIAIALIALCAAVPAAAVEPDPELIKQAAATAGGVLGGGVHPLMLPAGYDRPW